MNWGKKLGTELVENRFVPYKKYCVYSKLTDDVFGAGVIQLRLLEHLQVRPHEFDAVRVADALHDLVVGHGRVAVRTGTAVDLVEDDPEGVDVPLLAATAQHQLTEAHR